MNYRHSDRKNPSMPVDKVLGVVMFFPSLRSIQLTIRGGSVALPRARHEEGDPDRDRDTHPTILIITQEPCKSLACYEDA
jgi:hypothetical protein